MHKFPTAEEEHAGLSVVLRGAGGAVLPHQPEAARATAAQWSADQPLDTGRKPRMAEASPKETEHQDC